MDEEIVAMDTSAVDGLDVYTCQECAANKDEETVAMTTSSVVSLVVYTCQECAANN